MKFIISMLRYTYKKIFLLLMASLLVLSFSSKVEGYLAFIGCFTCNGNYGIYSFQFDPLNGKTASQLFSSKNDNPYYINTSRDVKILYASNRVDNRIVRFSSNPEIGKPECVRFLVL